VEEVTVGALQAVAVVVTSLVEVVMKLEDNNEESTMEEAMGAATSSLLKEAMTAVTSNPQEEVTVVVTSPAEVGMAVTNLEESTEANIMEEVMPVPPVVEMLVEVVVAAAAAVIRTGALPRVVMVEHLHPQVTPIAVTKDRVAAAAMEVRFKAKVVPISIIMPPSALPTITVEILAVTTCTPMLSTMQSLKRAAKEESMSNRFRMRTRLRTAAGEETVMVEASTQAAWEAPLRFRSSSSSPPVAVGAVVGAGAYSPCSWARRWPRREAFSTSLEVPRRAASKMR